MKDMEDNYKQRIPLEKIDFINCRYKLSKNKTDERLEKSIGQNGIIDPPVLIDSGRKYTILCGHNRLFIARKLGMDAVNAIVIEKATAESLIKSAILKVFNNELGPVGKAKLIILLRDDFKFDNHILCGVAEKIEMPREVIETDILKRILNMPSSLKDYLDFKDINIKIIRSILGLPDEGIEILDRWLFHATMRTNVFKSIISCIIDIHKRDKTFEEIKKIDPETFDDRRRRENYIHNRILQIRYPEYTAMKERADKIIKDICNTGVFVDFPEYFEGDSIDLRITVKKRDRAEGLKKILEKINTEEIQKLLDLL